MVNAVLYLATVLIWGTTWFAIKLQLGVVEPEASIVYRFALASVVLLAFLAVRRQFGGLPLRQHGWIALFGIFQFGINFVLLYHAGAFLASGVVAVVFSLITVMNIANGAFFFGRRLDIQVLAGAAMGLAGIAVAFWHDLVGFDLDQAGSVGLLLAVFGTLSASFGNMISARNQKAGIPVHVANGYGMAYASIMLSVYVASTGGTFDFDPSPAYVGALFYLAIVGSVAGFGCYLTLLGRIGPERAAYSAVLYPVVALAVSTAFEDFAWNANMVLGAGLVLAGNVVVLGGLRRLGSWWRGRAESRAAA